MLDLMTFVGQFGFGLVVLGGLLLAGLKRPPDPSRPPRAPSLTMIYLVIGALLFSMFLIGYTTAANSAVASGDIRTEDLIIK